MVGTRHFAAGALVLLALQGMPLSDALPMQDDAGSGMDAPDSKSPDVWIASGGTYAGNLTGIGTDAKDFYAFSATAGETLEVRASGVLPCIRVWRPTIGTAYQDCNVFDAGGEIEATVALDLTGTWYLSYENLGPDTYRFSIGIDAPAPPLGGDLPAPGLQDDAGSGQDAPETSVPEVWIAGGTVYQGNATGIGTDPEDRYAFSAAAGQSIQVRLWGGVPCFDLYRPDGSRMHSECNLQGGSTRTYNGATDQAGTWYLAYRPVAADHYRFGLGLDGGAPDPAPASLLPDEGNLAPGGDPTCGGLPVSETTATHGAGDSAFSSLAWAATKTGFRAVIVWQGAEVTTGSITVSLSGGAEVTFEDLTPRQRHVFVLEGLPVGEVLCFRATESAIGGDVSGDVQGDVHGFTLRNGPTSYDAASDTYTLNTLTVANEAPAENRIIEGTRDYGELLWDATDGHVKAGSNIILFLDPEQHNSGFASCFVVGSAVLPNVPPCVRHADVIYTNDASPTGAASTTLDAIEDPDGAIWMNWYWQGAILALDDTGNVLMHEMGHYAFGGQDLYDGDGGQDCWVPATKISIMGGNRQAREFDDELHRCPNQNSNSGYIPTWTLARQRFPQLPDRTSILPGPAGGGPENFVHAFSLVGSFPSLPGVGDDAGSGQDAPATADGAIPVQPGAVYQGNNTGTGTDGSDWYTFTAAAGQTIDLKAWSAFPCFELRRPDESLFDRACNALNGPGTVSIGGTADASGDWYIRVAALWPDHYRFAVGLDGAAPGPAPL